MIGLALLWLAIAALAPGAAALGANQTTAGQAAEAPSAAPTPVGPAAAAPVGHGPYLFVGFMNNGEEGAYFAVSDDGYHWDMVNDGQPVIKPLAPGELMRDTFIQRAPDGGFRLVWTWEWHGHTIGYSASEDLVHWSDHQQLAVFDNEPTAENLWSPAIYYEAAARNWLILWSSSIPDRFPDQHPAVNGFNHRVYSTTTTDFKTFEPGKLFFDPGYSVIDATIFRAFGRFYLLFKDEREFPLKKQIRIASGSSITGPWRNISGAFTESSSSGPNAIHVEDRYLVYYDHYAKPQHYSAAISRDLRHWRDARPQLAFPDGLRHGSFLPITVAEAARLRALKPPPLVPVVPVPESTKIPLPTAPN
jgi:hypothetical protein